MTLSVATGANLPYLSLLSLLFSLGDVALALYVLSDFSQ